VFRSVVTLPVDIWFIISLRRRSVGPTRKRFRRSQVRTFFINLARRGDRREEFLDRISVFDLGSPIRFEAIENEVGLLGCNLSHVSLLTEVQALSSPVIILEDDFQFTCDTSTVSRLLDSFLADEKLDVLVLSPTLYGFPFPYSRDFMVANRVRSCSGYVLKPWSVGPILKSFTFSSNMLQKTGDLRKYAFDSNWAKVQQRELLFAIPRQRVARQSPGFSDIQNTWVDYGWGR
jgi:hypothetical protein